jgi:catechol 2,3-dioxygenase
MAFAAAPHGIAPPDFRLPDATHLGRVKLQVSDLARSLDYYEHVVGLRTLNRSSNAATLAPHGDDVPVVELHERKGARSVPRRGLLGLYHFAILLPNRAWLGRFLRRLSEIGARAGMSDHFVSEAIYLQDPDNLGIEVYADRPRSEWRHENGQLSMTTIPLDVPSVIAAGGREAWTGMPPGTKIGHVHLHVGDLDEAEAFYHRAIGLDKTVWSYPGALFLSAGGYHHHLGTNTWARGAPSASDDDARLLEWEIVLPSQADVDDVGASLERASREIRRDGGDVVTKDPWGTALRFRRQS